MDNQPKPSDMIVAKLDEALEKRNSKGILVNVELFNWLKDRGRVVPMPAGHATDETQILDGTIFITAADLPDGEPFRLSPQG